MEFKEQKVEFMENLSPVEMTKKIEQAGRTCYKSEGNVKKNSAEEFVRMIISNGHESVLEHGLLSVKLTTNRAIANELVRHRIASYSQESTRYVNYGKRNGFSFISQNYSKISEENKNTVKDILSQAMEVIEESYDLIFKVTKSTDIARDILPLGLSSDISVSMNLRSWRHFFKLRLEKVAHPMIRDLARKILDMFREKGYSIFFEDVK